MPERGKVTREIPFDVTDEMVERGTAALFERNGLNPDHDDAQACCGVSFRDDAAAVLRAALESPVTSEPKAYEERNTNAGL